MTVQQTFATLGRSTVPLIAAAIVVDLGIEAALVGKDGGVKEQWAGVVEPYVIFDLVDAMPMRMREVRESQE